MLEQKLREEKVKENLNLVHTCANRFRGKGVDYDDLFQAGCVGLIKSVDGFDESLGYKFSTYAVPVIIGEIRRIFRDGGMIKVGRTLKEKSRNAEKHRRLFISEHGREPSVSELAEILGMSVEETALVAGASLPVISLTMGEDSEEKQLDIPTPSPEEEIADTIALKQIMNKLEEKDRQIIQLRYFCNMTQQKTADIVGMSQVQVSRAEKKILLKLRKMLE